MMRDIVVRSTVNLFNSASDLVCCIRDAESSAKINRDENLIPPW